jgi:hypothetical protein
MTPLENRRPLSPRVYWESLDGGENPFRVSKAANRLVVHVIVEHHLRVAKYQDSCRWPLPPDAFGDRSDGWCTESSAQDCEINFAAAQEKNLKVRLNRSHLVLSIEKSMQFSIETSRMWFH